MSTTVVAQKSPALFDDRCLTACELIDKLTVIVGQCELLSEQVQDAESVARLASIAETAKFVADALNGRHPEPFGTREAAGEQDHNSQ